MTHAQKSYVKDNWKGWLTFANFIILILIFLFKSGFTSGAEVTQIKNDIIINGKNLEVHKYDASVHMPFEKKIEMFVPRVELDSRMKGIKEQLDRIEQKLDN